MCYNYGFKSQKGHAMTSFGAKICTSIIKNSNKKRFIRRLLIGNEFLNELENVGGGGGVIEI